MKKKTFTVTPDHIKLVRRFYVGWQYCETGAPEIDPKRPYGNSNVAGDIHEILTGENINDYEDGLSEELEDKYLKLHKETETVLQIVLATGSFRPGTYGAEAYTNDWQRVIITHGKSK